MLTRAFIRALKAPPIAPSALSDFRAVGPGGTSRRLRRGFGAGLRGFKRRQFSWPQPSRPSRPEHKAPRKHAPAMARTPRNPDFQLRSPVFKDRSPTIQPRNPVCKTRSPTQRHPNGSQRDPLGGPCWGLWFLQGLAEKVVGLRGLRVAPRGFGWEGQQTGPQGGE